MQGLLIEVMALLREHEEITADDENERATIRAGMAGRIIARVVLYERKQASLLASLQEPS